MEAGLREQLDASQRIIRLAQLSRRHEVPADGTGGAPEDPQEEQEEQPVEAGDGTSEGRRADGSSRAGGSSEVLSAAAGEGQARDELGLRAGSSEQRLVDAFVRRTSGAALGRAALEQERLRLGAENAALRAVLATVQAGSSVGPGAVDGPLSTLLIVNGRLQKALGGAAAARRALQGQAASQ